jgi:hypothetical protein
LRTEAADCHMAAGLVNGDERYGGTYG